MLYPTIIAALAAVAAAGPTTQPINFAAILSATTPALVGPTPGARIQTNVYNAASAISAASAAGSSTVASASATASVVGNSKARRDLDLQKRTTWCIFGFCFTIGSPSGSSSSSSTTSSTSTTSKATTTSVTSTTAQAVAQAASIAAATTTSAAAAAAAVITSSSVTLPTTSTYVVPSTCTPTSWTNTNAFTSASACPSPYEVGTYCGFVNPEDPCAAQPNAAGPQVTPDTPDAFLAYAPFHSAAQNAVAPSGYAATFQDQNASVNANSYMGLYTLNSYDVAGCAAKCDGVSLCTSFNIYIERDPAWNPDGCSCQNPASVTNYKCTLWGSGVELAAATNTGETRDSFVVVIAGSNGYAKSVQPVVTVAGSVVSSTSSSTAAASASASSSSTSSSAAAATTTVSASSTGWTNPKNCSGSVHNHPTTCMGQKFFPGPFDVNVCASYANAQNSVNAKYLGWYSWLQYFGYHPMHCQMFNAFMVKKEGVAQGTYCSLFTQQYDSSAATYQPGYSNGAHWSVESSWSFCSS